MYTPPPFVPGLKLATSIDFTNLHVALVEADPAGKYDIYYGTNLASPNWTNIYQGVTGQTNFDFTFTKEGNGFFVAARSDTPVQNAFQIAASVTNVYVDSEWVQLFVTGGPGASMAILVNDTNTASARWIPYSSIPVVPIGTNEGVYEIHLGFKGVNGLEFWNTVWVVRDFHAPQITITNPVQTTLSQDRIQVMGMISEPVTQVIYTLTNAAGIFSNQQAFIVGHYYDTNSLHFTTNFFQCFDVTLTNGANLVEITAVDLAGNVGHASLNMLLDINSDSNAPAITLTWPPEGYDIAGTNLTIRGTVDDASAKVTAAVVDSNNNTNSYAGIVERNGEFLVESIILMPGANTISISARDLKGNTALTNRVASPGALNVTVSPVNENSLWEPAALVTGSISDSSYSLTVNGVQAIVDNGQWQAEAVPVNSGGTAFFDLVATPAAAAPMSFGTASASSTPSVQSQPQEKQPIVKPVLMRSSFSKGPDLAVCTLQWEDGKGGKFSYEGVPNYRSGYQSWNADKTGTWEVWDPIRPSGTLVGSGTTTFKGIRWEKGKLSDGAQLDTDVSVHLFSGGKAKSKLRRLYLFTGWALGYRGLSSIEWPFDTFSQEPLMYIEEVVPAKPFYIATNSLVIAGIGKPLDTSGELYDGVQDNADIDISIIAKAGYYRYSVNASRANIGLVFRNSGQLTQREYQDIGYQADIYDGVTNMLNTTTLGAGNPPANGFWFNFQETDATAIDKQQFDSGWEWHRDVNVGYYVYSRVSGTTNDSVSGGIEKSFNAPDGDGAGNDSGGLAPDTDPDANRLILTCDGPGTGPNPNAPPPSNLDVVFAQRFYAHEWLTWNGIHTGDILRWRSFVTIRRPAGGSWQRAGQNFIGLTPSDDPETPKFTVEEGRQVIGE